MENKCAQNKMGTNAKIRIYPTAIYLLKVSNENSRIRFLICSKLTKKRHQNVLIDMRTSRNVYVALVSLYLFLVFHS